MSLTLYGLKNCDTCIKALIALAAAGQAVAFIDIRAEADLSAKVPVWLKAIGDKALLNTRSTTWRGLDEGQRARDPQALLIEHPTLIKRPVIETGDNVYVGWTPATQAALGL